MKRWYLVVTIFLVFMLFLNSVYAGPTDKWKECTEDLILKDVNYKEMDDGTIYHCCCDDDGTNCKWKAGEPCCTDFDGDLYVIDERDLRYCGYSCGSGTTSDCKEDYNDCDDNNKYINPGEYERCSDGKDNNCNMDNSILWDDDPYTGVDCKDLDCAGKTGPGGVICCQSVSDCSPFEPGDCGRRRCSNNICGALKDTSLCSAVLGCGIFQDSCTSSIGGSYYCDYFGNSDMCGCDEMCWYSGSTYACSNFPCFPPNILDYCDESTSMTCAYPSYEIDPPGGVFTIGPQPCTEQYAGFNTCTCHSCQTCPILTLGGSTNIRGGECSI